MIWYALLIPIILTIISYVVWHKCFVWQELIIPTGISALSVLVSYYTLKTISMRDVEYNSFLIVEARYYEPWETWVKRTCSYTTCTGGKVKVCTTHYYDCSYCDYHSARYEAIDNFGHSFDISQSKYNSLIKKWSSSPKFNELNRSINHHGSCGKDGDMYSISWDNKIESSESSVLEKPFENIVKVSHSAFQFPEISEETADSLKLFHYPEIYDFYKQRAILGLEYTGFSHAKRDSIQTKFEYLNGRLGPKHKVKVFTLIFKNKPIDIAFKQEAYWDGGNQNEIVTCIGLNDKNMIDWVKPFSWCDNKRIIVDTREDVSEIKHFDADKIIASYNNNISKYFKYKSFKDFNYLTFEPTSGQLIFVYLLTIVVSVGCLIWCIKNNLKN